MSWKTCDNCINLYDPYYCDRCLDRDEWKPIPCPLCGGALSEVREHIRPRQQRMYRHCYSCHFEFKEES